MPEVQTVRGPVDTAALAVTLMHEHIFSTTADVQLNYPQEWGSDDVRIDDAVERLGKLAEVGVSTIVDPTVVGLGRYLPRIKAVADRLPNLNIIVATGIYTYSEAPYFFRYRGLDPAGPDPMTEMFVHDLTEGIADTGVRAAFLKCAIDEPGLTPGVERIMRSVARAHLRTGAPITVHTHPGSQQGLVVARVMAEEGVDPRQVVLGHSGDSTDLDHLSALAEAGFVLGMDRFGINLETTFEARADTVVEMCRRGFAGSMVLSHDAACYLDWIDPALLVMLPQWHYLHLHTDVVPYLKDHGVTDEQLTTMFVDNPRGYFGG